MQNGYELVHGEGENVTVETAPRNAVRWHCKGCFDLRSWQLLRGWHQPKHWSKYSFQRSEDRLSYDEKDESTSIKLPSKSTLRAHSAHTKSHCQSVLDSTETGGTHRAEVLLLILFLRRHGRLIVSRKQASTFYRGRGCSIE